MRILIAGAAGQLGHALQEELSDHELVTLDLPELDIRDLVKVRDCIGRHLPDIVINAAAYTDVDGAENDRAAAFGVNAAGARNLAIATAAVDRPLLHISTDYVFNGRATRPYHEYDTPDPQSVYGESKLAGEEAVKIHNPRHFVVRSAWLFHTVGKNFPRTMISLAEREEVRVVSDQRGCPTYAPHLARSLRELMATEAYGIFHLAAGGDASWFELTQLLYRELAVRTPVRPVTTEEFPRPAERPRYSVLTTMQSPRILLPPWQEGVAEFARAVRGA